MQKDFSYPVKIKDLTQNTQTYRLEADKRQLKALADILKVDSVKSFAAYICLKMNYKQHRLDVKGVVDSTLKLQSVISLEMFEKTYCAPFEYYFDTALSYQDLKEMNLGICDEAPDIVENGQIDLWQIAIEQLALVMDDYPKIDGEKFYFESEFDEETTKKTHPFAVLEKLKK